MKIDEKKERIERFEDLIAWQKARVLTKEIYQITRVGEFAKDFGLSGQIQRASVSIMFNIAEGLNAAVEVSFIISFLYRRHPVQRFGHSSMSPWMLAILKNLIFKN